MVRVGNIHQLDFMRIRRSEGNWLVRIGGRAGDDHRVPPTPNMINPPIGGYDEDEDAGGGRCSMNSKRDKIRDAERRRKDGAATLAAAA
jgi:hypothetical protein